MHWPTGENGSVQGVEMETVFTTIELALLLEPPRKRPCFESDDERDLERQRRRRTTHFDRDYIELPAQRPYIAEQIAAREERARRRHQYK